MSRKAETSNLSAKIAPVAEIGLQQPRAAAKFSPVRRMAAESARREQDKRFCALLCERNPALMARITSAGLDGN
jgi:hypothetical protein